MKKSVLFVDDEPKVLQALRNLVLSMGDDWFMDFAESGPQALQMMANRPFHVVVSDLVMPGMDGEQFLSEVMRLHPHTTRIIMCWNAERHALTRLYGIAHQYLFKPCDPKNLQEILANVFPRGELLTNQRLIQLVSQMRAVPSLPSIYIELVREMRSDDPSLLRAGDIIGKDPGMSAKILQLVNSAFYGLRRHVSSPAEAAIYLGVETIKALVLSLQVFSQFDQARIRACQLGGVWSHSWETAVLARRICAAELTDAHTSDNAFVGGLLHDIGKLVLASSLPDLYRAAKLMSLQKSISMHEAEQEVFGASHAEVGGFLLGLWGLPDPVVEAVAYHHAPSLALDQGFTPVTAVHAANVLDRDRSKQPVGENGSEVDLNYLANLNLMERFAVWQEICWEALQIKEQLVASVSAA